MAISPRSALMTIAPSYDYNPFGIDIGTGFPSFNPPSGVYDLPMGNGTLTGPTNGGGSGPWWAPFLAGGLGVLNTWIASRGGGGGTSPMGGQSFDATGAIVPASAGAVAAAIARYGGRIVGTTLRIARAAWARVPDSIKSAALALGLTLLFDDNDSNGEPRKRRRSRGITGAQLRGFNRVCGLLNRVGMAPRKLHRGPKRKTCR